MSQATRQSRGLHPFRATSSVFRMSGSMPMRLDPGGLRYAASLPVRAHWFMASLQSCAAGVPACGLAGAQAVYAPLFLLQKLGAGQCEVAAPAPPAEGCHLFGLRGVLGGKSLVWVLE